MKYRYTQMKRSYLKFEIGWLTKGAPILVYKDKLSDASLPSLLASLQPPSRTRTGPAMGDTTSLLSSGTRALHSLASRH